MPVVGIVVGSKAHEFDASTGVVTEYMYDTASMDWVEIVAADASSDDDVPPAVDGGGGVDPGLVS